MSKEKGFTLVELMVTIAIVGILGATALPLFQTWRDRARGAEAVVMIKQIIDAEIIYYLANGDFFPAEGETILLPGDGELSPQEEQYLKDIENKLNIIIPKGRLLDYELTNDNKTLRVQITSSLRAGIVPGVGEKATYLYGQVNDQGEIIFFAPYAR